MEQECTQQELSVSSDPVLEVELQSPMDEHWGCDVSRPEFVLGTSDFVFLQTMWPQILRGGPLAILQQPA